MSSTPKKTPFVHSQRRTAMKVCASGMLLCAFGFDSPAWSQQPPLALSTAINRAGLLRALSQRITKAYAQLVLGVLPEQAQGVMVAAQRIVKSSLAELSRAGLPVEASALLGLCTTEADHLAVLVAGVPAVARLGEVNKTADQLLANADKLTALLESRGKSGAKIINIAGRQRMLSQRIAKSYMLIEAGLNPADLRKQLDAARSEFVMAMDALEAAPVSTTAIKQNLTLARTQWIFYQNALDGSDKTNARRNVATTSERILEVMDTLTGLYDGALKELLGSMAYNNPQFAALSLS